MMDSVVIFYCVVLNVVFIVVGYVLCVLKIFIFEDGKIVFCFVMNVMFLVLLLYVMMCVSVVGVFSGLSVIVFMVSVIIFVCLLFVGVGCLFGAYFAYRKSSARARGLVVGSVMGVNLGMFVYLFVEVIWGVFGLVLCVMWDVLNVVVVFGAAKVIFVVE